MNEFGAKIFQWERSSPSNSTNQQKDNREMEGKNLRSVSERQKNCWQNHQKKRFKKCASKNKCAWAHIASMIEQNLSFKWHTHLWTGTFKLTDKNLGIEVDKTAALSHKSSHNLFLLKLAEHCTGLVDWTKTLLSVMWQSWNGACTNIVTGLTNTMIWTRRHKLVAIHAISHMQWCFDVLLAAVHSGFSGGVSCSHSLIVCTTCERHATFFWVWPECMLCTKPNHPSFANAKCHCNGIGNQEHVPHHIPTCFCSFCVVFQDFLAQLAMETHSKCGSCKAWTLSLTNGFLWDASIRRELLLHVLDCWPVPSHWKEGTKSECWPKGDTMPVKKLPCVWVRVSTWDPPWLLQQLQCSWLLLTRTIDLALAGLRQINSKRKHLSLLPREKIGVLVMANTMVPLSVAGEFDVSKTEYDTA